MESDCTGSTYFGRLLAVAAVAVMLAACAAIPGRGERSMLVTATAFNSVPRQTDRSPATGAWGDRIVPGMKVVAVSPDLVDEGLGRGTSVRIDGLAGDYLVLDRMPARWTRRIDVYMGNDAAAARAWGKRTVRISWTPRDLAAGGVWP